MYGLRYTCIQYLPTSARYTGGSLRTHGGEGGVCTRRRGVDQTVVLVCGVCVCVQSLTRLSLHARADLAAEVRIAARCSA